MKLSDFDFFNDTLIVNCLLLFVATFYCIKYILKYYHVSEAANLPNVRSVAAPITKPLAEGQSQPTGPPLNTCSQCERLIT